MFELSILRKYLIPQKQQLSVALLATLSVIVITVVVWLILLFLSVTEGIERVWLHKLTSLHAPIKITPTDHYLSSYHYLADTVSHKAGYQPRSFLQKIQDKGAHLYDPQQDLPLPTNCLQVHYNAEGTLTDPVVVLIKAIHELQQQDPSIEYFPFELTTAVVKLQLSPKKDANSAPKFLTQACYLQSFPENNSYIRPLLMTPKAEELKEAFNFAVHTDQKRLTLPLLAVHAATPKTLPWHIPTALLPANVEIGVEAPLEFQNQLWMSSTGVKNPLKLKKVQDNLFLDDKLIHSSIFTKTPVSFTVKPSTTPLLCEVEGKLGPYLLKGQIPYEDLHIDSACLNLTRFPTIHKSSDMQAYPITLAKNFGDLGVKLGDMGFVQYQSLTAGALKEVKIRVIVAGFYDPGVTPVGNKCILAPSELVHLIHSSSNMQLFDNLSSSGFSLWHQHVKKAPLFAKKLAEKLQQLNVLPYWKITTYQDYEFSKDLLLQFHSDRMLFLFLASVILIVASSNIISFLILLVHDKKKEIGILQALGASKKSIALIFGGCGACIGVISTALGVLAAFITLKYLNVIISLFSFVQGYPAFNPAFYGSALPSQMSMSALGFIVIAAPIMAFLAALIPAIKASKLVPSKILRGE